VKRASTVIAALLLAACAATERMAPVGTAPRASADLAAYLDALRNANEGALATEGARQKQAAARDGDDATRVKAAIALTLAHADESEVIALAEPVSQRETADPSLKAMASFLQLMAADRRRLRESAVAAGSRLREERRSAEVQKQRADALAERAAQLQQKLDALTELEKSLSDRQPASR
jgi:hypothetical protein